MGELVQQPITPANSEDVTCFVIDNPFQLFVGSWMSAAATQAQYGKTLSFTAAVPTGSEISGQCSNTLDYRSDINKLASVEIVKNC